MTNPTTIRLSITKEVSAALRSAKKQYPTLSDPEILKLGLSKIVTEGSYRPLPKQDELRRGAAYAVGSDYLGDSEEDIYTSRAGAKVHF